MCVTNRLFPQASLFTLVVLFTCEQATAANRKSYYCPNTYGSTPAGFTVPSFNSVKLSGKTYTFVNHPDGQSESLDLYLPQGVPNPPVLVMIHGGGFTGSTRQGITSYAHGYVAQDYAVANISYRLAGLIDTTNGGANPSGSQKSDPTANLFPTGFQDARCAVRWLRANAASLGINGNAIAAYGVSAGGNFAAMLGTTLDYDPTVYGKSNGGSQTLDSVDCPVGIPNSPNPTQPVRASASVKLVIDESGNDTIGQVHNTVDNNAWGNVQYFGDVADVEALFNVNFGLTKAQQPNCTAPDFPASQNLHCVTVAGLQKNSVFMTGNYPVAFPDRQFNSNNGNASYTAPVFFILNGAIDPVVGPQNSADLFDTMTGATAAGNPVLVESTMENNPSTNGVLWSGTSQTASAALVDYFLMTGQGHIPALLSPGMSQTANNNNGTGPDLQAASCAVVNLMNQVLN